MTTFLLLRHARHGLLDRVLAGRMPGVSLSEEGREQAGRLAASVAAEFPGIAAVWSSPLTRARETAEPLGARLGLAVGVAPELDEVDYGDWTGRRFDELGNDPRWEEWNARRATARVPGGETMAEARTRVFQVLERWREEYAGGTVALVSHCETIRAALLHALGVSADGFWRLEISPASLSILALDAGGGPRVLRVNGLSAKPRLAPPTGGACQRIRREVLSPPPPMKKLNLSEVPARDVHSPKGRYRKQRREVSVALGAREDSNRPHPFEVELVTLPPGASFCPYHLHTAEWEFYLVVSGTGQVRHPGGTEEIRAGDSFVFPPGEAHQILNPSPEPLTYYVIANNVPSDDCYYPDSDKWAIQSLDKTIRFTEVAYHEGEE